MAYFLHSPFTPKAFSHGCHRGLLLQFFLHELFLMFQAASAEEVFRAPTTLFPFAWHEEIGPLRKLQEHASLLESAFPSHSSVCQKIFRTLNETTPVNYRDQSSLLFSALQPLLLLCKDEETLIYFLLKHQEDLLTLQGAEAVRTLFETLHPDGTPELLKTVQQRFSARGFQLTLPPVSHAS